MNWDGAACTGRSELFFGPDDEPAARRMRREGRARAICARCPVQPACLDYAVTEQIRHGIWGGSTEPGRVKLRRWRREERYRDQRRVAA